MQIKIGNDELILWLRKNKKASDVENILLGRKIVELITKLGGKLDKENERSLWADDMSETSMGKLKIPITSQQYIVDTGILPAIYEKLSTW